MNIRSALGLSVVTTALLASSAAFATPIYTVDGVSFFSDSQVQINQNDEETLVIPNTTTNNTLQGIGAVTNLTDGSPLNISWTQSNNGVYLFDEFSGFTVDNANSGPNGSGGLTIALTGGQLSYYYFTSNPTAAITAAAAISASAAISAVEAGNLWLSMTPLANANGDTFVITLPTTNPSDVTLGSGQGFTDVTGGGAANPYFTTCGEAFANGGSPCPVGFSDFSFVGGSSPNVSTIFPVTGTDHADAISQVPEPVTLSLFGFGLVGAVAFGRRKVKKA